MRNALTIFAAAVLTSTVGFGQIQVTDLGTIDLDSTAGAGNPEFIGSNPSAVAWDGTDLYVAGFNGGSAASVGIVKVTDALGAATLGAAFGSLPAPGSRGYSGLDISGGTLAAAYDDGGTDPEGITAWDSSGSQLWAASARGGSGVGFDPGDGSGGAGVAWTTFGSGRRALQDSALGTNIFTTGDGMIITPGGGTFWRDMDFDDANGDLYARRSNDLVRCVRTGPNSCSTSLLVDNAENAPFVGGQNVALINASFGNLVIYNDRAATGLGQDFFSVVNLIDSASGAAVAIDWNGFNPAAGSGYYDFSWDAASSTLAILDFNNRNVHLLELSAPIVVDDLVLELVNSIDLDSTAGAGNPEFIGSNPSAIAWDGTDLYVAGFNGGGAASVGIVKMTDALGAATLGAAFGSLPAPGSRGYSGLDISAGGTLAAAYDDGGVDPEGITAWDSSSNQLWAASARGGSGVGFDPGDGSGGAGVAWTTFGSGRRALQDSALGTNIFTTGDGMIITPGGGTFWRDMDFDDANGDLYARRSNDVVRCVRTGPNSCSTSLLVDNAENAPFVGGQNVSYLNTNCDDYVIYNDRAATGLGQDFFSVVNVIDPASGATVSTTWSGFSPSTSSGYYDFSWDAGSQTLAVLDFSNRDVHFFRVANQNPGTAFCFGDGAGTACPCGNNAGPGFDGGCLNSAGRGAILAAQGCPNVSNDTLIFNITDAAPNSFGLLASGDNQLGGGNGINGVPPLDGLRCVGGGFLRHGTRAVNVNGNNNAPWSAPGGYIASNGFLAGQTRNFQVFYRDDATMVCSTGLNTTNAVAITFGD